MPMINLPSLGLVPSTTTVALASVLKAFHEDLGRGASEVGDHYTPLLSANAGLLKRLQERGPQGVRSYCALLAGFTEIGPVSDDIPRLGEAALDVHRFLKKSLSEDEKAQMRPAIVAVRIPTTQYPRGTLLVSPGSWAGEVQGIRRMLINGKETEVLVVDNRGGVKPCAVMIPVTGPGYERLRPLSSKGDLSNALSIVRGKGGVPRLQLSSEKRCAKWLREGTLQSLAFLLRDVLTWRSRGDGQRERGKLLVIGLRLFAAEMALIQNREVPDVLFELLDTLKPDVNLVQELKLMLMLPPQRRND